MLAPIRATPKAVFGECDYFCPSTSGTYARNPAKTSSLCSKNDFPLSRESIWAMSSSVSAKLNRSMLSAMCDGVFEPGMTTCPCWMCQRKMIWAGDFPCFSAIA